MKTCALIITVFLTFALFMTPAGWCQLPEELIQAGDRHFNRGEFETAYHLYLTAYNALKDQKPAPFLLSEAMNNVAAIFMEKNNQNQFNWSFAIARELKQGYSGRQIKPSGRNVLINGGFEDGLIFPWGTGHYERPDGRFKFGIWWNSMNARAYMKIDADIRHSGQRSLRITNYSPTAPHVFCTLSQRIEPLEPNTTYKVSCFIKAQDLKPGAVGFTIDAAWTKRVRSLPGGTYDWQPYSDTINIGHNNYIDFRILHLNTGTVWLDDIVIEKVETFAETERFERAERLYHQANYGSALDIFLKLEAEYQNRPGALRNVELYSARIYMILGRYREALERFQRVIAAGYDRVNIDLSELYYHLGDYDRAEVFFKKSLEIVAGDQGTTSLVMNKLSRCYLAQGKLDAALKAQQQALHILRHIDDKHGQAMSLYQLGIIYQQKKAYERAEKPFADALDMAHKLGDRHLISDIFYSLAENARLRGQNDRVEGFIFPSFKIKRSIGDPLGLVRLYHLLGRVEADEGKLEQAKKSYQDAIEIFDKLASDTADISRETRARFIKQFSQLYREYAEILIKLYEKTGNKAYYNEAFQISEQARSRIFTEMITEAAALQSFASTSSDKAFVKLLETERMLNARIHGMQTQLRDEKNSSRSKVLNEQLEKLNDERRQVREHLVTSYPRYARLRKPESLTIESIQKLLKPDEVVLSFFVTDSRTGLWAMTGDKELFSVIGLDRQTLIGQSEAFRRVFSEIPQTMSRFDPVYGKRRIRRAFGAYDTKAAFRLYQTMIAPAASLLQSGSKVYLALDDLLYKVPFEALITEPFQKETPDSPDISAELENASFWIKTHTIAYLPSLSVLQSLRKLSKVKEPKRLPLLAFADPIFDVSESGTGHADAQDFSKTRSSLLRQLKTRSVLRGNTLPPLPDTKEEAIAVAKILKAPPEKTVYIRDQATEYNLKRLPLTQYQNILFATHGLVAGEFGPGTQPALALSFVNDPENDGLLEMGEILGLNLNADLVVLSACNTAAGAGESDRGEGFAGLTRSFMYAGGRALLVTQWSVESSSAKTLVENMFGYAGNRSFSSALAASKRHMIETGSPLQLSSEISVSTAHPFFWAPYVLVGGD